jgi:hypothetical protein
MTSEMRFPEVSGPGLNWKAVECALDRESGVVRVRIGESEHLRDADRISLHEGILQNQKNQTSASEWDAGGIQACSRWSSVSDTTGFVPPLTAPRQGCKQLFLPKNRHPKEIPSNVD